MKAKKLVVLLTAVCLLGTMVACGEEKGSKSTKDGQTTVQEDISGTKETKDNVEHYDVITEEIVRNYPTTDASQFEYKEENGEVIITGYIGTDEIVSIPEEIDGKPVTTLKTAFHNTGSAMEEQPLKTRGVYIPESVKTIINDFQWNDYIEVVICEAVESLEYSNFIACDNLHTLILGNSLKNISLKSNDEIVIAGCKRLEEVYLPETLETIDNPECTFYDNSKNFVVKVKKGSAIEDLVLQHSTYKESIRYKVESYE